MQSLVYILPEIFLFIVATVLLVTGLFLKNIKLINLLAIFSLLVTVILILNQPFQSAFLNSFVVDEFSLVLKVMILIGSIASLIMFVSSKDDLNINIYEFPILIIFSTIGMMVMVSANDLLAMFIGLELQSLSLYVLAALNRNSLLSSEAGIKYFILGALSSGLLLFGISYIYGFSGNTNFNLIAVNINPESLGLIIGIVFVLAGLAFKVSAVPFHMWTPDVYQGAPTPITGFFALAPKIAAMGLLVRFLFNSFGEIYIDWQQIIFFISIASMMLAAFAAIAQTNLKRLMAYSSIGHIGYALIGVACFTNEGLKSLLIYLMIYLTGIPPLAGFFGKFYIFVAAIESEMLFLAIIGVIASVISAFYYLRIVKIMYFDEPKEEFDGSSIKSLNLLYYPSSILIIIFFIYPSPVINISEYAIQSII